MNLVDLLNANPEAKAEHENLIAAAGVEGVENAVADERTRTEELLNLAGGKVTPDIVAAIKNGDSIGDFAVNEIKNRNKEIEEKKTGDSNLGDLDAGNQTPKTSVVVDAEAAKEKAAKDSVSAYLNGGKK